MKRGTLILAAGVLAVGALAAMVLAGRGLRDENLKNGPLVNADGTAPIGITMVAPAPQEGFALLDNKDVLAPNGL